jgi:hypothetical protein
MTRPLASLIAYKDWVGLTDGSEDAKVAQCLQRASAMVRAFLEFEPWSSTYEGETYDGTGATQLAPRNRPITAVASVTIGNTEIGASGGYGKSGFDFDEKFIYLTGYAFDRGRRNVFIDYTAGFVVLPDDIVTGTLITAQALMSMGSIDPNVMSESVPGAVNASFKADAGRLPDAAKAILQPRKRVLFL